jgi:cell division protein FtsZ
MENNSKANLLNINITEVSPIKDLPNNVAKISVIGIGGGGCNMINHMIDEGVNHRINLIAANTDLNALQLSIAPTRIQLGKNLTEGLGAGMKPEIGKEAALESYDLLKESLEGSNIVFIAAGLGGGTGTGAAPIAVAAAKEVGAITVVVVTKPFNWEQKHRTALANLGLEELKKVSDSVIVIQNDKLVEIISDEIGIEDAFKHVDNVLYKAVTGISDVILNAADKGINTDFADLKTITEYKGLALMSVGYAKGDDAAYKAFENAIESPLLEKMPLKSAKGILIHFKISPKIPMTVIGSVMTMLNDKIDSLTKVIFGTTVDKKIEKDEVSIMLIATGFEVQEPTKPPMQPKPTPPIAIDESDGFYDIPPLMRNYNIRCVM